MTTSRVTTLRILENIESTQKRKELDLVRSIYSLFLVTGENIKHRDPGVSAMN